MVPANLAALQPRPHQQAAIEAALNGFVDHSRGQVIMACGTGKTLVAQRIAESLEATRGSDSLSWPHHDGLGWLHLVGVSGGVTV